MARKTRKKRGGRKWAEEVIPRTLGGLVRKLKDMEGTLIRISDGPPEFSNEDGYKGDIGILRNAMEVRIGTEEEVHVELESHGSRWWVYLKYPGNPFKIEVEVTPDFAPAAGGGRSKTRKKRRRSRRGGVLEILKPSCWTNSPGVMTGKRAPRTEAEHKCCCGTDLGVTEVGGAGLCKKWWPEECKKFSLTRPVKDMLETRKQYRQNIATEKEKEKGKKVRRYHITRKLHKNPKIAALRKKNAHLYGQPCKSKKDGKLYEEVKPKYGKKISIGGPGLPCVHRPSKEGGDCSKPENNPIGIPIQHLSNWLASPGAFKKPPSGIPTRCRG